MPCPDCGGCECGRPEPPSPLIEETRAACVYSDQATLGVVGRYHSNGVPWDRVAARLDWRSWWLPHLNAIVHHYNVEVYTEVARERGEWVREHATSPEHERWIEIAKELLDGAAEHPGYVVNRCDAQWPRAAESLPALR